MTQDERHGSESQLNVYCVLSEEWHEVSYERLEEDWGRVAVIVAARTRGQARYLAIRNERAYRRYGPLDWPRLWCKRLGRASYAPGVLPSPEANAWWDKVGDWEPARKSVARLEA